MLFVLWSRSQYKQSQRSPGFDKTGIVWQQIILIVNKRNETKLICQWGGGQIEGE